MNKTLKIVPVPKIAETSGNITVFPTTFSANDEFASISAFEEYADKLWGLSFTGSADGAVKIVKNTAMASEEYTLTVDDEITVIAADNYGAARALATLLQIAEADEGGIAVPVCTVSDRPDRDFRGVMIDLARTWHPMDVVLRYVDMCFFYKVKYLHLHLTDDQSYTLPSKAFPKLSTEGRSYTEEEIAHLRRYALERGVQIIPELDTPGHCGQFKEKYGEFFVRNSIICQHPDSMEAMRRIYGEVCEMFQDSDYIHIGGDEASLGWWPDCPKCMEYFESVGIDTHCDNIEYLMLRAFAHYISEMAAVVRDHGHKALIWEGFGEWVNDFIPKDVTVMEFESLYHQANKLTEAGFNVINCSWIPMYIVPPVYQWGRDRVFDWNIFRFEALCDKSPYFGTPLQMKPTDKIMGGELLAWGDFLTKDYPTPADGVRAERELVAERAPALAENTWRVDETDGTSKKRDYNDFSEAVAAVEPKLLKIMELN